MTKDSAFMRRGKKTNKPEQRGTIFIDIKAKHVIDKTTYLCNKHQGQQFDTVQYNTLMVVVQLPAKANLVLEEEKKTNNKTG